MKILIVANYNEGRGGISGVVKNHYDKLKEDSHFIEIFNTKKDVIARIFLIFPLIFKVKQFQVIHIHGCSGLGFYPIFIGIIASKVFARKKAIITYHGGGAENFLKNHSGFIKWFMKKANYITVMSNFLQNIFAKYQIETVILKNLINIKIETTTQLVIDTPRILSIRSLSTNYNIHDIISAFALIKNKFKGATLQIAGSGPLEASLKKQAEEISGITFLGQIPNKEITTLMNRNNVFITVPSHDNQPMSILEAFSVGIPVISTKVGGIPDMITDVYNGFLVDVHSSEQIADKVTWIFSNQNKIPEILANAKESVKDYQWPVIKNKLLMLYAN
ncbi:MAG: glycosyltransferase family 4 protein [Bacteroidota bacterium]|nr:glycosyltransferase family 4 protein [Bacteroidota bacterium]